MKLMCVKRICMYARYIHTQLLYYSQFYYCFFPDFCKNFHSLKLLFFFFLQDYRNLRINTRAGCGKCTSESKASLFQLLSFVLARVIYRDPISKEILLVLGGRRSRMTTMCCRSPGQDTETQQNTQPTNLLLKKNHRNLGIH